VWRRAEGTVKSFYGIKGDCASCDQEMIIAGGVKVLSEKTESDDNSPVLNTDTSIHG
jgi:hypothetical protein